ncbi:GGDEF domain-containing protein [uncultured Sphaerochaeta sp.]|uniref:GGDEF domain-containing protein n=1 Tax=uncultured Sphaerochaeta sp. TaxID=886478 RepID=UPI002A0A9329|nr:GGDEF domain-containing protein [uncultured Sphaerochaeta sp.]
MALLDNKIVKEKNFRKRQEWFCHLIVLSGYLCVLINFVALVAVWKWIALPANLPYTTYYYWMRYILIPTGVLLAVVWIIDFLVKREKISLIVKEYTVILLLVFCFAFLIVVHKIALVLLASFLIPIFISTMFSQPKLTRNVFLISIGTMIACTYIILPWIPARIQDGYLWVELFSALALVSCAYVFSRILIRYSMDNLAELKVSYEMQSRLHSMMQSDRFTGLHNRSTFDEFLNSFVEESIHNGEPLSLAILDLDHFKTVNDTYGHAKGDQVLLYFSHLLKNREGEDTYAFRFGGDEFAILYKRLDTIETVLSCDNLRNEVTQNATKILGINIAFSCGVATFKANWENATAFFNAADKALYLAKQHGRNRTELAEVHS